MTRIPYATAELVNSAVNASAQYRSDAALYGRPELWEAANGAGDCEDFALAKRAMLLKMGAQLYALRLATCWTETGEYHAVLVVATDDGEFVLDNRYPLPMRRQDLGYKWDCIQLGARWLKVI